MRRLVRQREEHGGSATPSYYHHISAPPRMIIHSGSSMLLMSASHCTFAVTLRNAPTTNSTPNTSPPRPSHAGYSGESSIDALVSAKKAPRQISPRNSPM